MMNKKVLVIYFTVILMIMCACAKPTAPRESRDSNESTTPRITESCDSRESPTPRITETPVYDLAILNCYAFDSDVGQLLYVQYKGGSDADITLYVKEDGRWKTALQTTGFVGKNGIDKETEGDRKTPTGDYPITGAFGIKANPGTSFSYINVTDTTYACDEKCEFYNQIIDTAVTGHSCTGEKMISYSPQYNYGLIVGYNSENIYPLGSAIFVHCKGSNGYTGGCIAVSESDMITILKVAQPGMRIYIGR